MKLHRYIYQKYYKYKGWHVSKIANMINNDDIVVMLSWKVIIIIIIIIINFFYIGNYINIFYSIFILQSQH